MAEAHGGLGGAGFFITLEVRGVGDRRVRDSFTLNPAWTVVVKKSAIHAGQLFSAWRRRSEGFRNACSTCKTTARVKWKSPTAIVRRPSIPDDQSCRLRTEEGDDR